MMSINIIVINAHRINVDRVLAQIATSFCSLATIVPLTLWTIKIFYPLLFIRPQTSATNKVYIAKQ